jgi:predicted nucleic acid-binding protein
MLVDTDIFIWCLRGNSKAVEALEKLPSRRTSVITRMELMQGCRDKKEHNLLRSFFRDSEVEVIQLSAEIGFRADTWMEQFHLSNGVGVADCLIAATAAALGLPLLTGNPRHFRCFPTLEVHKFIPA